MTLFRRRLFPVLAWVLWVIFLFLDITNRADSTRVKFAAICLCCVTALLGAKTSDGKLVTLALCFTVAADWFLLVLDAHYAFGIGLFIVVQFLYAYRLYLQRGKRASLFGLGLRVSLLLFSLALLVFFLFFALEFQSWREGPPRVIPTPLQLTWQMLRLLLPLFYFFNLVANTFEALSLGQTQRRFAVGLLLFVCCDVCVGLWNAGLFPGFTRIGMWLFYLPSQVLIVLSQEHEKGVPDEKAV